MDKRNQLRDTSLTNSSKNQLRELKADESSLIMSETDPNHAYGPNYYMLPKDLKIYYKYIRMRKYVHVQLDDEREILNFNYFFYAGIAASIFGVYFLSKGINKFLVKRFSLSGYKHIKKYPVFYYGAPASLAGSLTYGYLNVYFIRNYCYKFMDKYRKEAIRNGFDDYQVSEDKMKQSWTNYYHLFKI